MISAILPLLLITFSLSQAAPEWKLVWAEEFTGPAINRSVWDFESQCAPANQEQQCYTDRKENAQIVNGALVMTARKESSPYTTPADKCTLSKTSTTCNQWTNGQPCSTLCSLSSSYTSSRLTTAKANLAWKYGRFEFKAKLPKGNGLWPAMWFLPLVDVYGGWAVSGEIDLLEAKGNDPKSFSNAVNYGGHWPYSTSAYSWNPRDEDLTADYHVYALEWEEEEMRFYIDSDKTWTLNLVDRSWYVAPDGNSPFTKPNQPWDQPFYIILNIAIGGWFFQNPPFSDSDVNTWSDPTLKLDYIRVYQRANAHKQTKEQKTASTTTTKAPAPEQKYSWATIGALIAFVGLLVVLPGGIIAVYLVRKRMNRAVEEVITPAAIEPIPVAIADIRTEVIDMNDLNAVVE